MSSPAKTHVPSIAAEAQPTRARTVARLSYRALESRTVFDAAMAQTAAEAHAVAADSHAGAAPSDSHAPAASTKDTAATAHQSTGDATPVAAPAPLDHPALIDALHAAFTSPRGETLVFVDPRVADYQQIVAGAAPGAKVVLLNTETGGLEQIAAYLQGHSNVDSVHILSHGAEATLQLGGDVLTNATIGAHQAALQTIGHALRSGGDILLYGCDVAAGTDGARFISTIAQLTGDDVAASTDKTGAADLGGNWVLEQATGKIETITLSAPGWDDVLTLNVTTGSTAASLAANITNNGTSGLVVVAGSESLTTPGAGATTFVGQFTTTGSNLGIANGVVLATGDVTKIAASPTSANWTGAGSASNTGGNFDVANLKFDFKAAVGKVVVTYVFGSEEYNEYVNSTFNDKFFIDITGVNPAGGNYTNTHVSKVPGTTVDVAINSVNNGFSNGSTSVTAGTSPSNPAWFRDNLGTTPAVGDVVVDGLTKPISNVIRVTPGSTYTINFNIADVGDNAYNSVVFIDAVIASLQLNLDANGSSGGPVQGYQGTFTEKGAAVTIADTADTQVSNFDPNTQIQGGQIVLTNKQTGDQLSIGGVAVTNGSTGAFGTLTYTVTDSAGQETIQFTGTGTPAQYQAAIDAVKFSNATTAGISTVDRTFTVVVNDGETNSNTVTSIIHVKAVDDAPVTAAPGAQTVAEDTALAFSAANGNAITISDSDAGPSGVETVTLSVAHGNVTLSSTTGLSGISGNGTGSVTFTGTVAQINTAIDGLKYQGVSNYNGADTLTINVVDDGKDFGNATTNGAQSAVVKTVAITVTPVNDPPVAVNDAAAGSEDAALTIPAATLLTNDSDVDGDPLTITSVQGAINGTVALDVSGNPVFTPNPNYNGPASFTYTVSDGKGGSATATVSLTIAAVDDAPVTGVPAAQTVAEDSVLTFAAGNGNAVVISDVDANTTAKETVTLAVAHGNLTLATTTGLTGLTGNGTGTVSFTGTLAQVNAAIAGLTYQGVLNYNGPDQLTITVKDDGTDNGVLASNGAQSAVVKTVAITVTPVNDPPVAVNDAAAGTEDAALTIPAATLLLNDSDVDGDPLTITSVQGAVNGTVALDVSGNPVFTPNPNYNGPASFTYTVSDGKGGSATATVSLTIAAVDDAPVTGVPAAQTVAEDSVLTFAAGNGNAVVISDVDANTTAKETVTLAVAHGNLTLATTTGLTGLTGNGTGTVSFTGTLAQVNAAIAGLKYQGVLNYNGGDHADHCHHRRRQGQWRHSPPTARNPPPSRQSPSPLHPSTIHRSRSNDTVAAGTEDTAQSPFQPTTLLAQRYRCRWRSRLPSRPCRAATNGTVTLDVNGNPGVHAGRRTILARPASPIPISDGHGGSARRRPSI